MITKEEFREQIKEAIEELQKSDGELDSVVAEGRVIAADFGQHDPVLGQKFTNIVAGIEDLCAYLRSKAEKPKN